MSFSSSPIRIPEQNSSRLYYRLDSEKDVKEGRVDESLMNYKHRLALHSCTKCTNYGYGYIDPNLQPTKFIDIMFSKKIKSFACTVNQEVILITEDTETYLWSAVNEYEKDMNKFQDKDDKNQSFIVDYFTYMTDVLNNTIIVKIAANNLTFLALTDDGKMYYYYTYSTSEQKMGEMNINEKITCIACGCNFYVVIADNTKIYSWSVNSDGQLGISTCERNFIQFHTAYKVISGETFGNLFLVKEHFERCKNVWKYREFMDPSIVKKPNLSDLDCLVKVVCGYSHTLALTAEGKVYVWGENDFGQLNPLNSEDAVISPIMINIGMVSKVSDIAAIDNMSAVKSSEDGLVYIWGELTKIPIRKLVVEYTNIFDICNSMITQSIDMYTDEQTSILNDLEAAFNDSSSSDLTIEVEDQLIYVHKVILKIRSLYFRNMFQTNWVENNQSIIKHYYYSYDVYEAFLKYLYTGSINLSSVEAKLDLLILANEYCETKLEKDCIWLIRKEITVTNVFFINEIAIKCKNKELEEYCFKFYLKNMTEVMQTESFTQLDLDTKIKFITRANKFFTSCF